MATHRQIGPPITADSITVGSERSVDAVAFSPGGEILATGGVDGIAELWDVATHRQIGPPITADSHDPVFGGVLDLAFSPGGKILATAGGDGTARLWDIAFPGDLLRGVCAIADTSFTRQQWDSYVQSEPYVDVCRRS